MLRISPTKIVLVLVAFGFYLAGQLCVVNLSGLTIDFLDVGQGDAILIISPDKHTLLIDVGPDNKTVSELGKYWQNRNIDILVLSHFDLDHVGGLSTVFSRYNFKEVIAGPENDLKDFGYSASPVPDRDLTLGCCVLLHFYQHAGGNSSNAGSIALKVEYQGFSAFFDGDLPTAEEDQLAEQVGRVSLLKLAHHGSKTSTSQLFLNELQPELCVISVGKNNDYGHPHPELLQRLQQGNCKIMRTDEMGTISLSMDNGRVYSLAPPGFLW